MIFSSCEGSPNKTHNQLATLIGAPEMQSKHSKCTGGTIEEKGNGSRDQHECQPR